MESKTLSLDKREFNAIVGECRDCGHSVVIDGRPWRVEPNSAHGVIHPGDQCLVGLVEAYPQEKLIPVTPACCEILLAAHARLRS